MKSDSIRLLIPGLAIVVTAILHTKCTKDIGTIPPPPLVKCDTVTYSGQIKKIADQNCVRCHNPGLANGNYDFTSYAGLKSASDAGQLEFAIFQATGSNKMPQDSNNVLTEIEKACIKCWIENGEKP